MQSKNLYRSERGRLGVGKAEEWLVKKGFRILQRGWRPPRELGSLGEVDLLAEKDREIWLFEVKCHENPAELFGPRQAERQRKSRIFVRSLFPKQTVRWALIWIDPGNSVNPTNPDGGVEFLENPC